MNLNPLPRSTPESQGVLSSAIQNFLAAANAQIRDLHSFMFMKHGHVIAEGWWAPYEAHRPHILFSLSKSFTATAIGLLVAEGRLTVDDPVLSFFPDDAAAEVNEHLAAMRVRHLLSMSTGHTEDTTGAVVTSPDGNWVKAFLAQPVLREPGTHFLYNTGATYMLSAIAQRLSGQRLLHYLTPRLFEPLGIRVGPDGATWQQCPRGIDVGGFGLKLTTEDIAKFGQLYLQKGMWQGQRLITEAWVDEASAKHIDNSPAPNPDWAQGYGYQFWRCQHNAYRGDGAFGQYCIVMPQHDAVIAITSGVPDMQAVLNLVWQHLLPPSGKPERAEPDATLQQTLNNLTIPHVSGAPTSATAQRVNGQTYRFDDNAAHIRSLAVLCVSGSVTLTFQSEQGEYTIAAGHSQWQPGTMLGDRYSPHPVAASGAWANEDTFVAKVAFVETPFIATCTCTFGAETVRIEHAINMDGPIAPQPLPDLVGRAM